MTPAETGPASGQTGLVGRRETGAVLTHDVQLLRGCVCDVRFRFLFVCQPVKGYCEITNKLVYRVE